MKYLVIGPGAMGVYAFIGKLKRLKDDGHLDDLEEISASSAGALAAWYILTNMHLDDALKLNPAAMFKVRIKNLMKNEGLIDQTEALDAMKAHSSRTFSEMYRDTKVKLHVAAFSLEKMSTVYLSVDTAPDMLVAEAITASISIPIMFQPFKGYLDGSIMEELPWTPFAHLPPDNISAIRLVCRESPPKGLLRILTVILGMRAKYHGRTIDVDIGDINWLDFKLSHDVKLQMFLLGYTA